MKDDKKIRTRTHSRYSAEEQVVLQAYIKEVEMYRKEMKGMREQLANIASIISGFFAGDKK